MAVTQSKTAVKEKTTTAKGKKRQRDPKLRVERPVKKAARTEAGAEGVMEKELAAKSNGKASAKGKKPVGMEEDESEDEDEEDEQAGRAASKAVLKSLGNVSFADDNSTSSEEDEEDEDDDEGVGRDAPLVDVVKLPSSKDDKAVKKRLEAVEKRREKMGGNKPDKRGVLYIGRIPRGFYEEEMRSYFTQFGSVTRLRLSRNKKTGAPKHYGFIEFEDEEVAQIVQETMDNYLLMGHLLQVKTIPKEKVHEDLFKGANRKWRKMPSDRRERVLHDQPRTEAEQKKVEDKLLKRQSQRQEKLKAKGIDYDFPGYQVAK